MYIILRFVFAREYGFWLFLVGLRVSGLGPGFKV